MHLVKRSFVHVQRSLCNDFKRKHKVEGVRREWDLADGSLCNFLKVPLANVLNVPTVMLNGSLASVSFAGLTPGAFGLYQINFQVPKGTPSGDQKLEISQAGIPANVSLLPVGQQPVCQ